MLRFTLLTSLLIALASAAGCSSSSPSTPAPPPPSQDAGDAASDAPVETDDQRRDEAVSAMHDALLADVKALHQAAIEIQAAAPAPPDRGWDATEDAAALAAMREAWTRARTAYEHVEGALAPLFPDLDESIDFRYDDFLAGLIAQGGDPNLFDGEGVTGMHAIERVLYADTTPGRVVEFEKTLPGYVPAAFPATAKEASDFKTLLCARLVTDTQTLLDEWTPAKIDVAIAFDGLTSLVTEQREKVQKASSNEEESRYAQRTMTDLRDNLAGSKTVYAVFRPWILSKPGGDEIDRQIGAGFAALEAVYGEVPGEAIPQPPATWSAENPSPADLATPFGKLYQAVTQQVDPNVPSSIVAQLDRAADLLGFHAPGAP